MVQALAPPIAAGLAGLVVLTYRNIRRIVILILGTSVLLVGVAMLVLPGPAILVIPAGLAILATEFAWARRLLRKIKDKAKRVANGADIPSKLSNEGDRGGPKCVCI
jgi:tellurite resistance protein TerC